MKVDAVIEHCHAATMAGGGLGEVLDAIVALAEGRIAWVGPRTEAPRFEAATGDGTPPACDARGGWLTPGLVDAHTHPVYAGDRAHEFEMRLEGAGRADDYIDAIVSDWLPRAAREGLADAVDAFCERIAFSPAQCARVFDAARALGLHRELGTIEPGRRADLALWGIGRPAELACAMGTAPLVKCWQGGR
jgi:imidazolonepropionase-like amidohydrolase